MSAQPLVTIGLPVYNSERYVRQSLDSLLAQTYADFVLVISDNASTDGTQEICRGYAARDPRIEYHRNAENIGNPGNFNRVASLVRTKYLKWSTADDYWAPTFVERALAVMEQDESLALCYPDAVFVDADGQNPTPYQDPLQATQDDPAERFLSVIDTIERAHQHLGLIRMDRLRRTKMLARHVHSDINLLAELAFYGKFLRLPERLFFRRFHKTSGSWNRGDKRHDAAYYLAANQRSMPMTRWRWHARFFAAVQASPLPARVKLRLYDALLRRAYWGREMLLQEVRELFVSAS